MRNIAKRATFKAVGGQKISSGGYRATVWAVLCDDLLPIGKYERLEYWLLFTRYWRLFGEKAGNIESRQYYVP